MTEQEARRGIRWTGKRTLSGGRLEVGRFWFAWRGWSRPVRYSIGSTRVVTVGPVAVFIQPKGSRA